MDQLISPIRKMFRLLFFQITREEMLTFNRVDLIFGLIVTVLVGIGRYWDKEYNFFVYLGIGSPIYAFVFSIFLWIFFYPFRFKGWTYTHLLTFLSFGSLPGFLYIIPAERFFDYDIAIVINYTFLFIVLIWRLALLVFYLRRYGLFNRIQTTALISFPLTIIVTILALFIVVATMGGFLREPLFLAAGSLIIIICLLSISASLIFYLKILKKHRRLSKERGY